MKCKHLIGIAALTVMLLGAMTGCAKEGEALTPDDADEIMDSMTDEDWEELEALEEMENAVADAPASEGSIDKAKAAEISAEVGFEPSSEIIQADFSSLLIQLNNDVFQQGGYMTVAELVEQYGDKYAFTYREEAYEDRKNDLLIEYSGYIADQYEVDMIPLDGDSRYGIRAYIMNLTSPDEKVALGQAYVVYLSESRDFYTPVWTPNGFFARVSGYSRNDRDGLEFKNPDYTLAEVEAFLKDKGFTRDDSDAIAEPAMKYRYDDYTNTFEAFFAGEPNVAGLKPLFCCAFSCNSDTDKLEDVQYCFVTFLE